MALDPGTRVGSYEIIDAIGAGGMGEVYRAIDTTLERDVAVKVLPESFSTDADWVARFEREAKTLAALNHPNIAHIYGLEREDGTTALIMELVDGPTLADRIAEGSLPADEALSIAMQIAEALEAAHGRGIVHRDLKPANIKLRADGTVKVLDFGIAKALNIRAASGLSPVMTTPTVTKTGIILGTAAYMSPEQARGKGVDERTDIWAFGCVLYEMLTGQPAFGGEDVTVTLARILERDPDMSSLPTGISPAAQQTLQLCLKKDVSERIADIRDVRLALKGAFDTVSPQGIDPTAIRPMWDRPLPVAAAAVLVTGIAVGFAGWNLWPVSDPQPVNRFSYELPDDRLLRNPALGSGLAISPIMALSPDGRQFVYNTGDGLYLRAMGDLDARLVPGTEPELASPVFSPDGQWVAYYDTGASQLKRIAVGGGVPVVIDDFALSTGCGPCIPFGQTWGPDGTLLLGQTPGIYRVPADGGTAELVIDVAEDELPYGPRLLPDGDSVLFTLTDYGLNNARIVVQSLSTGERKVLVEGGSDARYLQTGHLVYAVGDALFAVAFDVDSLAASGGAVPLVQGVMRANTSEFGAANFAVADDGTLVYVVGGVASQDRVLVWVDREGQESPITAPPRGYVFPKISPDGTKVALDVRDQDPADIWIWDFARESLTRLTSDPGLDRFPVWSPDGRRIAFSSTRGGRSGNDTDLFWQAADGTGPVERLLESSIQNFPTSFLPDGMGILVFGAAAGRDDDDITLIRLEGEASRPELLLGTTFDERNAEVSPDGRWMAYSSNETGGDEVYVRPFPDIDRQRWTVSTGGGAQPLWSRDGRELFYRNGEALMAVAIETDPDFSAGVPERVFEDPYRAGLGSRRYDITPDGERFLMIKQVENASTTPQIIVVQNWLEEVKRLVPSVR